ncbi:MAG: ABC transporter ATP-binding protein [Bacteroidetes bacterium]|nr:ABC transporter ATP-binding protein [Bacteroidota bacterium]
MSSTIIKAEGLSKYYRLGAQGSGRFREDWSNWWKGKSIGGDEAHIWALKDVSFEIKEGEVVGFIGRNGAGKSTLLKIISRITQPTKGSVKGRGRIASLLEVGTGFHGDLTGRENIFLNGHILGMTRAEILSQFDAIVEFSGVETFLDTPVKRYSSGMYVRLAFAVAAHLTPEILIVDEVLAVGDAEFQQKCLRKMKEVSRAAGRTVLFVSHNMQALRNLCQRAFFLEKGELVASGDPGLLIAQYLQKESVQYLKQIFKDRDTAPGNDAVRIKRVELLPEFPAGGSVIDIRTALRVELEFWYEPPADTDLIVGIHLFSVAGDCIFDIASPRTTLKRGLARGGCLIPANFLNDGDYYISIVFVNNTTSRLFYFEGCLSFQVADYRENTSWYGKWIGHVRPDFRVSLEHENQGIDG